MSCIRLTEAERQELENLHKTCLSFVVRERCFSLLLSDKGNSVTQVSRLTNRHRHTVEKLFSRWSDAPAHERLTNLFSAKGQGAKIKLKPVAELLPDLVEQHSRNLKPIFAVLEKEHSIKVSKKTLQNFLKGSRL